MNTKTSMAMTITATDLIILNEIANLHFGINSLEEYSQLLNSCIGSLFDCEYNGIAFLSGSVFNKPNYISNNPPEYESAYHSYLKDHDYLFEQVLLNPDRIHSFGYHYRENAAARLFYDEGNKIRPNGDYCYIPIKHENALTGFIGMVKGDGNNDIFDERDFILANLVLPHIRSAITYYSLKQKIKLLEIDKLSNSSTGFIYIWQKREIEILVNSNISVIKAALEIKNCSAKMISNHPFIRDFLSKAEKTSINAGKSLQETIRNKNGLYSVKIEKIPDKIVQQPVYIIAIEKKAEPYDFDTFINKNNLSKRETDIVKCVIMGLSNKEIAEQLYISVDTVKKHLYHIFEKTGYKNKPQLISGIIFG